MAKALIYSALCILLAAASPNNTIYAADSETPGYSASAEKTVTKSNPEASKVPGMGPASQSNRSIPLPVPLPSAVWLMVGGLIALILIRRRNKQ